MNKYIGGKILNMEGNVLDYEIIENIEILYQHNIILYGIASLAERMYSLIKKVGLNVIACCDGSDKKIGGFFHEWRIEKFEHVIQSIPVESTIILICSTFVKEIIEDCLVICDNLNFVTPFGFRTAFVLNRNNPKMELSFSQWYNEQYTRYINFKKVEYQGYLQHCYGRKIIRFMESDAVLVYQGRKVGSSTIMKSLEAVGCGSIHIHYFHPWMNGIPPEESLEYLQKIQRIISSKEKIRIITLVRDPLARDISSIFQSITDLTRDWYQHLSYQLTSGIIETLYNGCDGLTDADLKPVAALLKNSNFDRNRPWLFSWFDFELKEIFNIDVYVHPFDKEKGYSIIRQNNVECMVIKLEKLNECTEYIADFLGVKEFSLHNSNIGNDKPYSYLYKKCKQALEIPEDLIDYYYAGDSIRHFYTEEELSGFKKKWKENGTSLHPNQIIY